MDAFLTCFTYILRLIFAASVIFIFLTAVNQAFLAIRFLRVRRLTDSAPIEPFVWPSVTVQLPVFNEPFVIDRLLDAVAALKYPAGLLDVQILDDSTDETTGLIERRVRHWKSDSVQVAVLRRTIRKGFKAGALAEAHPRGELVAILDADFVPEPDFLLQTVPAFRDPAVACVQAGWAYLNRRQNGYTRLQSIGLAGHFLIEQTARNRSGWMSAFNGTCGLWRTAAIRQVGGWHTDTLTEDLDLSIRAQLAGWKIKYMGDLKVRGELPAELAAVRTQQFRWSRGGAQTARKLLGSLLVTPMSFSRKWQGFFQLNASAVWAFALMAGISGILLSWLPAMDGFGWWSVLGWISLMASVAYLFFHAVSVWHAGFGVAEWLLIPVFLLLAAGWSPYLARAVIGGWLGRNTPFIRTPKTGGRSAPKPGSRWQGLPELVFGTIILILIMTRPVDSVTIGFQMMLSAGCLTNGILLSFPNLMRCHG